MSFIRSKGERRFDDCQLRAVTFVEHVYTDQEWTITNDVSSIGKKDIVYGSAGIKPMLECPKTEDMGSAILSDKEHTFLGYPTKREGLKNIRKIAGATACSVCEYAGKTMIEVADMRTERAEAEKIALLAEANLKHLKQQIASGKDVVTDLAPNGLEFTPTPAASEETL